MELSHIQECWSCSNLIHHITPTDNNEGLICHGGSDDTHGHNRVWGSEGWEIHNCLVIKINYNWLHERWYTCDISHWNWQRTWRKQPALWGPKSRLWGPTRRLSCRMTRWWGCCRGDWERWPPRCADPLLAASRVKVIVGFEGGGSLDIPI